MVVNFNWRFITRRLLDVVYAADTIDEVTHFLTI